MSRPTILCLASFEKGHEFLRQSHREGCPTYLLTSQSLQDAPWPRECLEEIFFMPDRDNEWHMPDVLDAVSYLNRRIDFEKIVALDDFDVEKGAALREHLRLPGLGDSAARHFRDKLAMRKGAQAAGIPVPRFVAAFNDVQIRAFLSDVPPPYVLKPRTQAGAIGIQKVESGDSLWPRLDALGDRRSHFLIEAFLPGAVFHVDSVVVRGKVVWSVASAYGIPPLETSHLGRVFRTQLLPRKGALAAALRKLNARTLSALGLDNGVSHSEYIQDADGNLYFLETSARVGGAHIAEMIEAGTGANLWREWARLEACRDPADYAPPGDDGLAAGILVCLAKQERPDLSAFDAPEVWWRMDDKPHHAGVIVRSRDQARVDTLLDQYTQHLYDEFFTALPPQERALA